MAPQKWLHNVMQPPIFRCTKRYDPHPICTSPTPPAQPPPPPRLINERSLNDENLLVECFNRVPIPKV